MPLQFGWHMHSFPVDGSDANRFMQQTTMMLDLLQDRVDSVWVDDHFWPWAKFQSNDTPYVECMTTIAYLAACYPRLKWGSSVLCQAYRNPGLMAKMVANLQWLTGGRFLFGMGAGWMEEEYQAYHYDFPKPAVRIAQLEEAIQIVHKLWQETPASFQGKYYQINDAYLMPKPDPIPPLLIGGGGEQLTLRVVAKYADWWNIPGGSLENYAHKLGVLRQHCDAIGRDFDAIVKTWSAECVAVAKTEAAAQRLIEATPYQNAPIYGTPEQVAAKLQAFVDLGVTYLIVRLVDFPSTAGMELFLDEVVPLLQ
ncbi:MAG: LLM class flavin-dependent oxidoreductase [Caldilineaceae bacterium]|nr:LLM class flavin-dependent oxidoreductase [Caldilineaceae bacterium]